MPLVLTMLRDFVAIFIPLFVVIDPAGTLPVFLGMTAHYTVEQRRQIARRACVVAAWTGVIFVILGQAILSFLGLSFADFQIAGGILLVVLAIIDLLTPGKPAVDETPTDPSESVGVVPLAVPLIVGPATMTTSLLLVNTYASHYEGLFSDPALHPAQDKFLAQAIATGMVSLALLINIALLLLSMWHSHRLVARLGKNALAVINKIVMILIAAIAVSLIRQGITSIVRDLQKPL